ncbi:Proline--tRNA ligase [Candidatus Providencia siddallii]|uniref:Proline--tRNA ligase n=1 Tax=Candidatus Providencia siddallii TaxID=1715285 RepID=A0A0M6W8V3_9GAMM|nr:Proline--tRNA ligase [Candidatus Providencia siddallii]
MRTSKYLLSTLKETPLNAEAISHKLMLRAGMIYNISSGIYSWLPTGLRVLRKIENIIRKEMEKIGAIELFLPVVQPVDLWRKSGRLELYGSELFRFVDRNNRNFILGPTHEEVISNLIRDLVISYKQLPLNLFQIQTKFRDEVRPRYGVMRSREFIMKDAYSFHIDHESLQKTYNIMYDTYKKIFSRIGLKFYVVKADTGSIGGSISHEFQVIVKNGENSIVFSTESDFVEKIEFTEAVLPSLSYKKPAKKMSIIDTINIKTINDLVKQFNFPIDKIVKTLIVHANENSSNHLIALLIRGDHKLNKIKAEKHPLVTSPLQFATKKEIKDIINADPGFLGPVNISIPIIADRSVIVMNDFISGSNIKGKHYIGINWLRDLPLPEEYDLRDVVDGDMSPDGKGILKIKRGIEIGHIFQLGTKYSEIINVSVQDKKGRNQIITMGCYGIGITRIIAAAIEQNHDDRGIIWSDVIAPFQVAILPIDIYRSYRVRKVAEDLYIKLNRSGIDVILDDRNERVGVMFSDMELIGVPYLIIIGEHNLNKNKVEYRERCSNDKKLIEVDNIIFFLKEKLAHCFV